ncbi:CCA tRNA nucleotidyltransferase, mitochondrial [Sparassis crispa]|uniref:CCA tRNA nucleotidyltransferase, mitochondrial n=1 Tax=Sparassis crispa TaxID=139825 RepID=A0A401G8L4_9APHY|nr:CCA tRNA nucleotidyltransferase, mitochondrial [Sparassis crispa]GBE78504.1 CCA tRNA nucleotidyltransferase, mitochondrial [Sparassis crispa]
MEIKLTEAEDELCTLLDECTRRIKEKKGLETTCRIAGGWVRDKLLGHQSHDIDIALQDMMGMTFAEHFVTYCRSVKHISVKNIAKIESNPDQSKHLETAKTTVLDLELDFVNLRSEEYAEHSRIPTQVAFGTPLQDALRRDITINALFYNVHSRVVEDHTGKGLDDMRSGTIRTPLPPKETFSDDPLRVIRCIRFASRYGFDMVPELQEAAQDPEIQEALASKISRERVGEELDKMMRGRDPLHAIKLIKDLSLFSSIFHIPQNIAVTLSARPAPQDTALAAASYLYAFLNPTLPNLSSIVPLSFPPLHHLLLSGTASEPSPISRLYLACALTPYRGVTCLDSKDKIQLAVEPAIREGLKLGVQHHYLDGIPTLFAAVDKLGNAVVGKGHEQPAAQWDRAAIGLLLREKVVHNPNIGSTWSISLLFSLVQELVPLWDIERDEFDAEEATKRVIAYNELVARIEELKLPAAVDAKPILDGRTVMRTLGTATPGPWTGDVLSRVVEWQLRHPEGSTDECQNWLISEKAAGRINIVTNTSGSKRKDGSGGKSAKKAKR